MNINNCDILFEGGRLRLVYDMPSLNFPMTLVHARSNHELNEKAMKIFDPKEWIHYLAEQGAGKSISPVHPLLADAYKNHKEDYMAVLNNINFLSAQSTLAFVPKKKDGWSQGNS